MFVERDPCYGDGERIATVLFVDDCLCAATCFNSKFCVDCCDNLCMGVRSAFRVFLAGYGTTCMWLCTVLCLSMLWLHFLESPGCVSISTLVLIAANMNSTCSTPGIAYEYSSVITRARHIAQMLHLVFVLVWFNHSLACCCLLSVVGQVQSSCWSHFSWCFLLWVHLSAHASHQTKLDHKIWCSCSEPQTTPCNFEAVDVAPHNFRRWPKLQQGRP